MTPRTLVAAAAAALLLAPVALGGVAAGEDGYEVLVRTVEASRTTPYSGEALSIVFATERPYVTTLRVAARGDGRVAVERAARTGAAAGGRAPERDAHGWAIPLPMAPDVDAPRGPLQRNYRVEIEGRTTIMARPATILAFRRQADAVVRERLWVDDESSLPLRRETYGREGELVRLGTFLSLDLDPGGAVPPSSEAFEELEGVVPVEDTELEALRKAGWAVPDALPGGYEAVAAYAFAAGDTQPLKVVYADGLYTVSVFQQAGSADWDSLPAGAERFDGLPGEVYEWPGALPHRLVWSADGRTWSLIGDAPPDDLEEIARALPQADPPDALERLRRGFSRLWRGVSKWGAELWN